MHIETCRHEHTSFFKWANPTVCQSQRVAHSTQSAADRACVCACTCVSSNLAADKRDSNNRLREKEAQPQTKSSGKRAGEGAAGLLPTIDEESSQTEVDAIFFCLFSVFFCRHRFGPFEDYL